jgi:membrane protein DedA with SNARE-associated domain
MSANTVGTLVAAAVIYLAGVLSGVLTFNVLLSLLSVAGAVVGAGLAFFLARLNLAVAAESAAAEATRSDDESPRE